MDIEDIQSICRQLPGVKEGIKWGHDLVFSIGDKMYCGTALDESPVTASFKVKEDEYEEMCNRPGFKPAPYVAKHKWVWIEDIQKMKRPDWRKYLHQAYELVKKKLSAKTRRQLGIE